MLLINQAEANIASDLNHTCKSKAMVILLGVFVTPTHFLIAQ